MCLSVIYPRCTPKLNKRKYLKFIFIQELFTKQLPCIGSCGKYWEFKMSMIYSLPITQASWQRDH